MVIFEIIAEACCWMFFAPAVEAVRKDLKGKPEEAEFVSSKKICSYHGCNAMRHEESIYCLRHKPSKESKEETQQDENWWEDEKE